MFHEINSLHCTLKRGHFTMTDTLRKASRKVKQQEPDLQSDFTHLNKLEFKQVK